MKSKALIEIEKIANKKDAKLSAKNPRFKHCIKIVEDDGTILDIVNAFFETEGDEWIIVYAEHHSPYIVHRNDLVTVDEYKIIKSDFPE